MSPIKLFAYINIDKNPMIAWEVAIGRLKSVCDQNTENFGVSLFHYARIRDYVADKNRVIPRNEMILELVREIFFPTCVSRLQGLYFFEDAQIAELAIKRWGFSFNPDYLSEVEFYPNKITKVDSEWITHYLGKDREDIGWMKSYWSGEVCGVNPLSEIIASGMGIVLSKKLQELAYRKVMEVWPYSTRLLAVALAAFASGKFDKIAQQKAAFVSDGNRVKAGYYIDMNQLNDNQDEVGDLFNKFFEEGFVVPIVNHPDPEIFFSIPDMTRESFEFEGFDLQSLVAEVKRKLK